MVVFSFLRRCKPPPSFPYNGVIRATVAIVTLYRTIIIVVSATGVALVAFDVVG